MRPAIETVVGRGVKVEIRGEGLPRVMGDAHHLGSALLNLAANSRDAMPQGGLFSLKAAAGALGGGKAVMAERADAERATGYVLGGISPLGQRSRLRTVVDASAQNWEQVLCSAGRRGLEIELAPADLIRLTGAVVASITAGP